MTGIAELLLRRSRLAFPELVADDHGPAHPEPTDAPGEADAARLVALEADLLVRGFLLSDRLRHRLAAQSAERLADLGTFLLAVADGEIGAAHHVPLFRRFPESVPEDTAAFWVDRVFTLLLQEPEQPCVLCGRPGTVHPVNPCAHLVCRACWDGADFSGCPICHRRIDPDDPFLQPCERPWRDTEGPVHLPRRATVLGLGEDPDATVRELLHTLLSRQTPPAGHDLADIAILQRHAGYADLGWLPRTIPVRATRAVLLHHALRDARAADLADELLEQHVDTATDVLRLLYVRMGGSADLVTPPPHRRSLPRRLRRTLLRLLDRCAAHLLIEDMRRHTEAWRRMGEVLHPFERHRDHPTAALAFAVVRGTRLDAGTDLGRVLRERAAEHPDLRIVEDQVRFVSVDSRVEAALADGDPGAALDLLRPRPGALLRRVGHLLSLAQDRAPARIPDIAEAVGEAARRVSPGVLAALLGALRARTRPPGERVFFPSGDTARVWIEPERRAPLLPGSIAAVTERLTGELLRRADALPRYGTCVLDADLDDLLVPFTELTASASLVQLPRGSRQPLPEADALRLFLHWTQAPEQRVDLDLSVAFFDEEWRFIDLCDYTKLRGAHGHAVHSGDLTSAPAPLGATEFVDLDFADLRAAGIAHLAVVVFSFNGVPFEELPEGFAGFLTRPEPHRPHFAPEHVEQRFDLRGNSRTTIPCTVDPRDGTLRWLDANMSVYSEYHNVTTHSERLALIGRVLGDYYASPGRMTLGEAARAHAAARADRVLVRRAGAWGCYRRGADEDAAAFAARLDSGPADTSALADVQLGPDPVLFALTHGDLELPDDSVGYALRAGRIDPQRARLLSASDLLAELVPEESTAALPATIPAAPTASSA